MVEIVSMEPVTITSISILMTGNDPPTSEQKTYQLLRFRPGSTTGELADSFVLTALGNGRELGNAIGATIPPVSESNYWYGVVARLRIKVNHPSSWGISGLQVMYRQGTTNYSSVLKQHVQLPTTPTCH